MKITRSDMRFISDRAKVEARRYYVDPDDLAGNVLEQLVRYDGRDPDNREAFLTTVVRGHARNMQRSEARRYEDPTDFDVQTPGSVEDDYPSEDLIDRVRLEVERILERVPSRYRPVAIAYYLKGLGTEAISEGLGLPKGTVKQHLWQARRALTGDDLEDLAAWDAFNRTEGRRRLDGTGSRRLALTLRNEGWV